ncbi:MAG: 2-succinyl-5-enolpyruvyl-6-hydroxy-3-cyclohexene-1-carboxylic-acid synthase [Bacteroidales bacterium]|nr:2-succinyl-5-enolpyruvyl-6-hydroxy-3-cyclohexene-1-carboxylic-acid synthase [Bacteroidales bacterium]
MLSTKKNVLQTVALLKAHGVDHIVISPGSRNAPLTDCFSQDPFFKCFSIVDERSAGYFAIGLINKLKKPVTLCCTSGTALLNYAPAVAEAFYQELPLVVVSADRSPAWIGQMDGQTLPQQGAFGQMVRKSVQLPEIHSEEDTWYCNRLINEALMACTFESAGPVHINIPISEPLFDFTEAALPPARKINAFPGNRMADMNPFSARWNESAKRMILIGQMPQNKELTTLLEILAQNLDCVVLCEHLSNAVSPSFIGNFDALICSLTESESEALTPDLLITLGGHVVSKRVKKYFRNHPPKNHWHMTPSGMCPDSFQCLTDLIKTDPLYFFKELKTMDSRDKGFAGTWIQASSQIAAPEKNMPFSDIAVVGSFLRRLPEKSSLFVGNSSSVRNIQLYPMPANTEVFCNRGTNGIEGSISTASGYAAVHNGLTFLLIGDLSFFYDLNGLWNKSITGNLRILLINNGGGGIFNLLPGLDKSEALGPYIAAQHNSSAEGWVHAAGFGYLKAENTSQLEKSLSEFVVAKSDRAIVLEVFTSPNINKSAFNSYYHLLKKQ